MRPWFLEGGDCAVGKPVSEAGLKALRLIGSSTRSEPVAVYESSSSRMGREAEGYVTGGKSPRSDVRRDVVEALFRRRLVALDLGPIARSWYVYITPEGKELLGIKRAKWEMDWEDSDNLVT